MQFNSMQFLLFFPLVVIAYYAIPKKVRMYWLLVASYFFYMCWNPKYVFLLITSTISTYLCGLWIHQINQSEKNQHKKLCKRSAVIIGIFVNIGMLVYFKYFNFFVDVGQQIAMKLHIIWNIPKVDVLLPMGISFYVFQVLGYLIDVYRENTEAEKNIFKYALFVSFFPQLVAGPIERSCNLMKQLEKPHDFNYEAIRSGLIMMLWGFMLKVTIADRCAVYVNAVYSDIFKYDGIQIIVCNLLFAVQIYCDFMGYSTIAKGAAKTLGIDLMENFNSPYFSVSIKDFWRRWHISLSSWLKDYLYIPLGGNRKGKIRKCINILIVFLVSGLWHGASITFVLWGLLHGLLQVIEECIFPLIKKVCQKIHLNVKNVFIKTIRTISTFILVDLLWILFRASTINEAICVFMRTFEFQDIPAQWKGLLESFKDWKGLIILAIGLIGLIVWDILKAKKKSLLTFVDSKNMVVRYAFYWIILILIMFSTNITGQEFIYFQF